MSKLDEAVQVRESLAAELFDQLRESTHDGVGITRASYGEGEQFAHSLIADTATELGLEVTHDAARNTFMTLAGADRSAPAVIVGSHLDSVAQGGNFDGAAGVIAGLVVAAAMRDAGMTPARDLKVMGIRAEEGEWFGVSYIGSRSALGLLPEEALDGARRADTGRTLREHMHQMGCDPDAILTGEPSLPPASAHGFIEIHIEQGPVLDEMAIPIGLVTGVRGNSRLPNARCTGEFSHCGGVPRSHRRDAVAAVAELVTRLDDTWSDCERLGKDFAFTVGKLSTDAAQHAMSKIAGAVDFTLDMRSVDGLVLTEMEDRVREMADDIGHRRSVEFDLGDFIRVEPGVLSPRMREELSEASATLGVRTMEIASGASHDAAAFAAAGVPSAMLFIRNANGSHNPHEAMALSDFTTAARVLARWLAHSA